MRPGDGEDVYLQNGIIIKIIIIIINNPHQRGFHCNWHFLLKCLRLFCSKRGKQKKGFPSTFYRWISCCFDDDTCKLAKKSRYLEPGEKAVESDTKPEKNPDRDCPMSNVHLFNVQRIVERLMEGKIGMIKKIKIKMVVGPDTKPERVPGGSMFITWERTSLM